MSQIKSNYTQLNNEFIDDYMSQLSGNACKVFMAISRKTIGWHKDVDKISNSQLMEMTGIKKRKALKDAIDELIEKDLIVVVRMGEGKATKTFYEIKYSNDIGTEKDPNKDIGTKTTPKDDPNGYKNVPNNENNGYKNVPHKINNILNKDILNKEEALAIDKQLPSPEYKDGFNKIREKFKEYNPKYYHDGKQAKYIKLLLERFNNDVDRILNLLDCFVKTKTENKKEFWRLAPLTPQGLYTRLDYLVEKQKKYTSEKTEKTIEILKSIFSKEDSHDRKFISPGNTFFN